VAAKYGFEKKFVGSKANKGLKSSLPVTLRKGMLLYNNDNVCLFASQCIDSVSKHQTWIIISYLVFLLVREFFEPPGNSRSPTALSCTAPLDSAQVVPAHCTFGTYKIHPRVWYSIASTDMSTVVISPRPTAPYLIVVVVSHCLSKVMIHCRVSGRTSPVGDNLTICGGATPTSSVTHR